MPLDVGLGATKPGLTGASGVEVAETGAFLGVVNSAAVFVLSYWLSSAVTDD